MSVPRQILATAVLLLFICLSQKVEAKRLKPNQLIKCQDEECNLSKSHFELYSYIKRSIESDFDLKGKEIIPLLRSVEILQKRFDATNEVSLNGTKPVISLLENEKLNDALKEFLSDDGRSLIDFYRASINGKMQNLACTGLRIQDIERISGKLNSRFELSKTFNKIHRRYIHESANKCLSSSCNSFDARMNKLDYIFGKQKYKDNIRNRYIDSPSYNANVSSEQMTQVRFDIKILNQSREFELEELTLCRFFTRSNINDCMLAGRDLEDVDFGTNETISGANSEGSKLNQYLKDYYTNNMVIKREEQGELNGEVAVGKNEIELAKRSVVSSCKRIRGFLDYNLEAINWYRKNGYIGKRKFMQRGSWCPSLFYWLHVDRICRQLEGYKAIEEMEKEDAFTYELANNL